MVKHIWLKTIDFMINPVQKTGPNLVGECSKKCELCLVRFFSFPIRFFPGTKTHKQLKNAEAHSKILGRLWISWLTNKGIGFLTVGERVSKLLYRVPRGQAAVSDRMPSCLEAVDLVSHLGTGLGFVTLEPGLVPKRLTQKNQNCIKSTAAKNASGVRLDF